MTSASALMAPAPMFSPKVDKQLADRPLSCKRDGMLQLPWLPRNIADKRRIRDC